ncbi:hypothetical protein Dimus_018118 [Dionaea muscipula]
MQGKADAWHSWKLAIIIPFSIQKLAITILNFGSLLLSFVSAAIGCFWCNWDDDAVEIASSCAAPTSSTVPKPWREEADANWTSRNLIRRRRTGIICLARSHSGLSIHMKLLQPTVGHCRNILPGFSSVQESHQKEGEETLDDRRGGRTSPSIERLLVVMRIDKQGEGGGYPGLPPSWIAVYDDKATLHTDAATLCLSSFTCWAADFNAAALINGPHIGLRGLHKLAAIAVLLGLLHATNRPPASKNGLRLNCCCNAAYCCAT